MYKLYDNVIYSYINLPDVTQLLIKYYDFFYYSVLYMYPQAIWDDILCQYVDITFNLLLNPNYFVDWK